MNGNDFVERALERVRALQDRAQPLLDEAGERLRESADVTAQQTAQAIQAAADSAKPHVDALLEQARRAASEIAASLSKKPEP